MTCRRQMIKDGVRLVPRTCPSCGLSKCPRFPVESKPAPTLRRFQLHRQQDISGVSGTGIVAEGVLFSTGWVAMTWLTAINSMVFYPSIENVEKIHGHDGATRIVWLDREG